MRETAQWSLETPHGILAQHQWILKQCSTSTSSVDGDNLDSCVVVAWEMQHAWPSCRSSSAASNLANMSYLISTIARVSGHFAMGNCAALVASPQQCMVQSRRWIDEISISSLSKLAMDPRNHNSNMCKTKQHTRNPISNLIKIQMDPRYGIVHECSNRIGSIMCHIILDEFPMGKFKHCSNVDGDLYQEHGSSVTASFPTPRELRATVAGRPWVGSESPSSWPRVLRTDIV